MPNKLYGDHQDNTKDSRLVENVLYGEEIESNSNADSGRLCSNTVNSEEYTYIVSKGPGETKPLSVGYKNPSFDQKSPTAFSGNTESVYYESAVPDSTVVMKERKEKTRDDEVAQTATTGDLNYASLDGSHARVGTTHDSTEGNYY